MKTERLIWGGLVAVLLFNLYQKQPAVVLSAPPAPVVQVSQGAEQPCLRITHRYNPSTGALERIAADDPLGIRPVKVYVEGKDF